jgi:hypothetical protein
MSSDELQVLRDFRGDTPQPDAAARRRIYQAATRSSARRRRRLAVRLAALGAAAVAVALAGLALLPGDESSSVARAAAALSPPGDTILHTVVVTTTVDRDGAVSSSSTESWRRNAPPYDGRSVEDGGRKLEEATVGGRPQAYDPRTNTIHTLPAATAAPTRGAGAPVGTPVNRLVRALLDARGGAALVPALRDLLESGEAREDGRASAGGREAIRIGLAGTPVTMLVDAETYEPLEWTVVSDEGIRATTRFETYEVLPATDANLALLSLAAQHPDAAVEADLQGAGAQQRK